MRRATYVSRPMTNSIDVPVSISSGREATAACGGTLLHAVSSSSVASFTGDRGIARLMSGGEAGASAKGGGGDDSLQGVSASAPSTTGDRAKGAMLTRPTGDYGGGKRSFANGDAGGGGDASDVAGSISSIAGGDDGGVTDVLPVLTGGFGSGSESRALKN